MKNAELSTQEGPSNKSVKAAFWKPLCGLYGIRQPHCTSPAIYAIHLSKNRLEDERNRYV